MRKCMYMCTGEPSSICDVAVNTDLIVELGTEVSVDDGNTRQLVNHVLSCLAYYLNLPIDLENWTLPRSTNGYKVCSSIG